MRMYQENPHRFFAIVSVLVLFFIALGFPLHGYAIDDTPIVVRQEIGTPLQAAQDLIGEKNFKAALVKIREADAIDSKTASEIFVIERLRTLAAVNAGDNVVASKSIEIMIESGRLNGKDRVQYVQTLGGIYYRIKQYKKAALWFSRYLEEGGTDPGVHDLLSQAYYLDGDYDRAGSEILNSIQLEEKNGRIPSEQQLQLLASCAIKKIDTTDYIYALEKMLTYYPKKEHWADLLSRIQAKPEFSGRLSLDVLRLKLSVGQLDTPADIMDMAQLSLQAGFPSEALKILRQGFRSGALGAGDDFARQKRLQDLAVKAAADDARSLSQSEAEVLKLKDGVSMANLGFTYITLGKYEKGLSLIEGGLTNSASARRDEITLHYGIALLESGQREKALQIFKSVRGKDGIALLARYWAIHLSRHPS
jgi:tetratricopeptide (TPR) repeat protein